MKKLRTTAVTLALALAVSVAGIPAQGAQVSTQKMAFGSWTVPTDRANRFDWFFAVGMYDLHAGEDEFSFAAVGKGSCVRERGRNSVSISCSGRSGAWDEDPAAFEMDPAASEARIRIRNKGVTHTARIGAGDTHDDGIYTSELECDGGAGFGGGLFRMGDASARMFGRKLTTQRWFDFSVLMSGGFVEACDGALDLLTDLRAGETIELTFARD